MNKIHEDGFKHEGPPPGAGSAMPITYMFPAPSSAASIAE